MNEIRERLEQDLRTTISRLKHMGGTVALEELPAPASAGSPFDDVDLIQATESREIGFATRALLVERVNRLAAALERLNDGQYGTCVECGEDIAPARLRAMPEVQTCVRCQDRLERLGRQLESMEPEFSDIE